MILSKTNKTIGLLRKLQGLLPRQALITIYKVFVRPHLDYGGVLNFIYISFSKQYHTLNRVFRLLHSYAEMSNIFSKINYDGQNFQGFT